MSQQQQDAVKSMPVVASVTTDEMRQRIKRKSRLKGRQVDDAALAEVRALLGREAGCRLAAGSADRAPAPAERRAPRPA